MTSTKSYVKLEEKYDRVIVLIDMDCFYCQVEELLDKSLANKPIAVVQYVENAGIIAVNYAARAKGVTRHMREKEAKAVCSDLVCIKVPSKFNKADISKYRDAGKRVANVFEKFTSLLERASIDEAYMDITELVSERVQLMRDKKFALTADHLHNTYFVGYDNIGKFIHEVSLAVDKNGDGPDEDSAEKKSYESSKLRLLIGASIVSDIRKAVKEETGYECSAGIAHNKILAKLVCGMNKPNKQTVLPIDSTPKLFENLEISKIKSMGGKIGEEVCKKLDVKFMAELLPFAESDLQQQFGPRIGSFLYLMARGIDLERVERKVMSKSIAVSKNFRGKNEIINVNTLKFWLKELSKELKERLDNDHEETNRVAKQMIVQFTQVINKKDVASSRTVQLNGKYVNSFTFEEIGEEAFKTIEKNTPQLVKAEGTFILNSGIKHLGISAGKLEEASAVGTSRSVQDFLKTHKMSSPKTSNTVATANSSSPLSKFEYTPPKAMKSEHTNVEEMEPTYSPKSTSEEEHDLNVEEISAKVLKSSVKCTVENAIKGVNTLRHWIQQLLAELDEKFSKENGWPTKIKLSWKQLNDDSFKSYSEEVPLDIFPNGINADFFINLIKDSSPLLEKENILNPIGFIEFEASEFSDGSKWNLNVKSESEDQQHEAKHETFEDDLNNSLQPSDLMDVEFKVDEDEILKLEQSFLESSPDELEEACLQKSPTVENAESNDSKKEENVYMEAGPSYMSDYVELQTPSNVSTMMDVLNPLEECVECGKMIRKLDMITHIDGHIAMKISIAQREEYRTEQRKRLMQKIENKTVRKAPKPKAPTTSFNTIEKFAKKESSTANETSWDNSVLCEQCNQLIELENIQMHQDYHYAKKLRMEQMTSKTIPNSGTKRKRPNVSVNKDIKSAKSLKEYFKE